MVDLRFANSLQIMLALANNAWEAPLVSSSMLATSLDANPAFVRKLLVPLTAAGLIETVKGKTGGARLARAPKQISLREIYEAAVDSSLVCGPGEYNTSCVVGACMGRAFSEIANGMEEASLRYLEGITLDKLLTQVRGKR